MLTNTQQNQTNSYESKVTPKSIGEIRQSVEQEIYEAYQSDVWTLIHALPNSGKSYGVFKNLTNDTPLLTYAAARDDLREQAKAHCEKFGLTYLDLPSPQKACPTFKGEHGEKAKATVTTAYDRGVSGSKIHMNLNPPCIGSCDYQEKWAEDFDKYDVLIAHYKQLYPDSVTEGRNVVVDEFSESGFSYSPQITQTIVSNYMENHPEILFEDYADLRENRDDDKKRQAAINWFVSELLKNEQLSDTESVLESTRHVHTSAAKIIIGLLYAQDLGNGFETTKRYVETGYKNYVRCDTYENKTKGLLLGRSTLVHNRKTGATELLTPPNLSNAHNVIALDGTPTMSMWQTAFGHGFNVKEVVPDLNQYLKEIMNYRIVQIGSENSKYGGVKPYSSGEFVNEKVDSRAILEAGIREGQKPSLISTKQAIDRYSECDALNRVSNSKNYHRMLSSNGFEGEQVGFVSGSMNYGDDYVKKWCALDGKVAESNGQKGLDKSFGERGDEIFRHFRENQVLQAMLRFGRDKDIINDGGATIYLNTLASPNWLEPDVIIEPMNANVLKIAQTLREGGPLTQSELVDELEVSKSTVSRRVDRLEGEELVEKKPRVGTTASEYEWCGR